MTKSKIFDVIIVGGGLAGLTNAPFIKGQSKCFTHRKNSYPKHKVCGEYISNEVIPYLNFLGIDPIKGAKKLPKFKSVQQKEI